MSFSSDVKRFAEKTGASLGQTCRAIKISLFSGVILDTRVDTGRLRGNWQTSTKLPNLVTTDRLDKTGQEAIREVTENVGSFSVDYMTNNLPYAEIWEEKDGMVEKNIQRTMNEVKRGAIA